MNEQIEKIYGEACITAGYLDEREFLEKFAELIVQECLDVMSKKAKEAEERFTYMGDDVPTTVHQINIMKHFGVEE